MQDDLRRRDRRRRHVGDQEKEVTNRSIFSSLKPMNVEPLV
jgi:hypothetical protein